ncbi:unnamed protein product, partial [Brassica rapa subsp. trilocularis]
MEGDLMCYGFLSSYTSWILHGEEIRITENARVPSDITRVQLDSTLNLLDDLFPDINMNMQGEYGNDSSEQPMNSDIPSTAGEIVEEEKILRSYLLIIIKRLYPGCSNFTKFSIILKLYHIKCMCGVSDKGISMVLDLMKEAFTHAKLPDSFND